MLGILLFVALAFGSIALCPPDCSDDDFSGLDSFDYTGGDYTTITDWSVVDWTQIPSFRIPEVPAEFLDYLKLDISQREQMTSTQITYHFNEIDDLTIDVNEQEAVKAIKEKYGIDVNLGNGASLKQGVFAATYGFMENVPIEKVSKTTEITIDVKGQVILLNEPNPPSTGEYTVDYLEMEGLLKIPEIVIPGGYKISVEGELSFKDGQAYVKRHDTTTINDLEITNGGDREINVYFDGVERPGTTSISMDLDKKKLFLGKGEYNVMFKPGNVFLDVQRNDFLSLQKNFNSVITIQNRGKDLIPLMTVTGNMKTFGEGFFLYNGIHRFTINIYSQHPELFRISGESHFEDYYGGDSPLEIAKFGLEFVQGAKGSVPFALSLVDNPEEDTFQEIHRVIFDNSQNFIVAPEDKLPEVFECKTCTVDFRESKVLFDYSTARILKKSKIQHIEIDSDNPVVLYRISQMLDKLPPAIKDSILELQIVSKSRIHELCGEKTGGCAKSSSRRITIPEDASDKLLYHEAAHTFTFQLDHDEQLGDEEKRKLYQLYKKRELAIKRGVPTPSLPEMSQFEIALAKSYTPSRASPGEFRKKWEEIAGDVYGKDLGEKVIADRNAVSWSDGGGDPRYGCVRPYGCNNIYEDIATFVEPIVNKDFAFYQALITPGSKRYDSRYRQKLDLLHEYGFMVDEDYQKIVGDIK